MNSVVLPSASTPPAWQHPGSVLSIQSQASSTSTCSSPSSF
eukprot:CAMPEP_0173469180 /NCGR_PEP_ID=MMETSP1357-20121228/77231_1 /TAXON_ID=77926 /ORGANISM="Hemiselmis rufescens, Strain PCC563" /LENGTH=40 /DNA_ID= /DNA_START= /DNA_END= /DNA_ORIENTATION=